MKKNLTPWEEKVIGEMRQIPRGRVTTYGLLAKAAGRPGAARAVGNAVGKNPYAPQAPCHRVVGAGGRIGGYAGGIRKKITLLRKEGITIKNGRVVDFDKRLYRF